MTTNILTQSRGHFKPERDAVIFQLREQGLTYQEIADMFKPPMTRQGVHIAIKRFKERRDKKASA